MSDSTDTFYLSCFILSLVDDFHWWPFFFIPLNIFIFVLRSIQKQSLILIFIELSIWYTVLL